MPFGVFFGVNVGKTGDFYNESCKRWGMEVKIIENTKMIGFSRRYR